MGDSSDREALRRLLRRVEKTQFEPTLDERRVLSDCENRVLLWATAAGIGTSSLAALGLRRAPFPGPMSRLLAVALPGALAAQAALSFAGEQCLCDLVAIAESSPLGGEAVRVLLEVNPGSQVLAKHAPSAARWAPESLPRLPEPNSGEDIRARLAALRARGAPPPSAPAPPKTPTPNTRPSSAERGSGEGSAGASPCCRVEKAHRSGSPHATQFSWRSEMAPGGAPPPSSGAATSGRYEDRKQ